MIKKLKLTFFVLILASSFALATDRSFITPTEIKQGSLDEINLFLLNAKEGDTATIYVETCGGDVLEGMKFLTAIAETKARVITKGDHIVASLGFIILLSGHEIHISDNTKLMAHLCVNAEGEMQRGEHADWINNTLLLENISIRFIFEQTELDRMSKGDMIWFKGNILKKRIFSSQSDLKLKLKD